MATRSKPKAPRKPAEKKRVPEPQTQEEILAAIGVSLDVVEAYVTKQREQAAREIGWKWGYSNTTTSVQRGVIDKLCGKLEDLLDRPDDESQIESHPAEQLVNATFGVPDGETIPFSRPGRCLVWVGNVPVHCTWGGFAYARAFCKPIDPRRLWLAPIDALSFDFNSLDPRVPDMQTWFHNRLLWAVQPPPATYKSKPVKPTLYAPSAEALAEMEAFAADPANAWWVEQMAKGPVDPVPLPDNMAPVQRRFSLT